MKTEITLAIPTNVPRITRCVVTYEPNPIGSDSLYLVPCIEDAKTGEVYPLDQALEWNDQRDIEKAIDIATHSEYAKQELGVDLKRLRPKKPKPLTPSNPNQKTLL